jgi:hypothetical protein
MSAASSGYVHLYIYIYIRYALRKERDEVRWWRVTLHVHTCSGRNRIIPLVRRPNTDSAPNKPVTLPRNHLWYVTKSQVPSTLSRYGVTIRGNVTSVDPSLLDEQRVAHSRTLKTKAATYSERRCLYQSVPRNIPEGNKTSVVTTNLAAYML